MFEATKSKSASSSTMQASFPPSSICRGIMPAFFEIATPVSPPVKLTKTSSQLQKERMIVEIRRRKQILWILGVNTNIDWNLKEELICSNE